MLYCIRPVLCNIHTKDIGLIQTKTVISFVANKWFGKHVLLDCRNMRGNIVSLANIGHSCVIVRNFFQELQLNLPPYVTISSISFSFFCRSYASYRWTQQFARLLCFLAHGGKHLPLTSRSPIMRECRIQSRVHDKLVDSYWQPPTKFSLSNIHVCELR
jgi:hypothetical protein